MNFNIFGLNLERDKIGSC